MSSLNDGRHTVAKILKVVGGKRTESMKYLGFKMAGRSNRFTLCVRLPPKAV